jgi:putative ABC transport system substrate-binding protein
MLDARRREFVMLVGGAAAAWPFGAHAQQNVGPAIGFLHSQTSDAYPEPLREFRQGLKESGYVEGDNLAIEYRWAQSQVDRLRSLTADLVSRRVAVIAAMDTPSALATKEVIAPTSMLRIPPSMYLSPSAYPNTGCSHPGG